jgi:hypothetical protein
MDAERQKIFRGRFLALMSGLTTHRTDPKLRAMIGTAGYGIVAETGALSWSDLKARADGPTYDKVLAALSDNAADMARKKEGRGVRAFEVLAVSMISRHQSEKDLVEGVKMLDSYIDDCVTTARKIASQAK